MTVSVPSKNFIVFALLLSAGVASGQTTAEPNRIPPGWRADTLNWRPQNNIFPQPDSLGWRQANPFQQSDTVQFLPQPIPEPSFQLFRLPQDTEETQRQRELSQLRNSARQYEFMGQFERALEMYQRVQQIAPDDRQAFDGIRRSLTALRKYDEVVTYIEQKLRNPAAVVDRAELLADLGAAFYQAGQLERADSSWNEALLSKPVTERNYQAVANAQLGLRLLDEAVGTYLRGRRESSDATLFSINLAGLYAGQMNWEGATQEYLLVLRENDRRVYYVRRGLANFPDDPKANAVVIAGIETELKQTKNREAWPGHRSTLNELLIDQKTKNGDYSGALPDVAELDELEHGGGNRLLQFAAEAIEEKQEKVASDALVIAAKRMHDPEGEDVISLMGARIAENRGEYTISDSLYSTVLRNPASARVERSALLSRGLVRLQHLGQAVQAVRDFRTVRGMGWPSEDRRLDYYEALALVGLDSLEAALVPLQRPVAQEPPEKRNTLGFETESGMISDTDLDHLAARILLWRGDRDNASALLDSILNPPVGASAENETLQLLHLVTATQDTTALTTYARADHARFNRDFPAALVRFDSLADNSGTPKLLAVEAAFSAAMIRLQELGDTLAVPDFADRYGGHPRVEEAWYAQGTWWEEQGNEDEAAVAYEMVLMNFPGGLLQSLARLRLEELTLRQVLPSPSAKES